MTQSRGPGGFVTTLRLGCGRAVTLFYEPGGLLLRSCLIAVDDAHTHHLLTFQLGYLGAGEITVHVALEGDFADRCGPKFTSALLRGTDADDDESDSYPYRIPGAWLTYAMVAGNHVNSLYTVWGQPAAGLDDLHGELVIQMSGTLPLLTATTTATATRRPLPEGVRSQPVLDWNQEDGREFGSFRHPAGCVTE